MSSRSGAFVTALFLSTSIASAACAKAEYQDTEANGVKAKLDYAKQYGGVLHLAVRLRNESDNTVAMPKQIAFSQLSLTDAASSKKYFPLKDAYGHFLAGPASDWNGGGRWFAQIPPKTEALFWVFFNAIPEDHDVSFEVPGMFPFDTIQLNKASSPNRESTAGTVAPMKLSLVSATRAAGRLTVRLKVNNPGPYKLRSTAISWSNAYAFDVSGARLYPVLKDSEGMYAATPRSDKNDGGRWWVTELSPGQTGLVNIIFQAPPDSAEFVDILIPHFEPLLSVPIAGKGGAPAGGIAVLGKTLGLEQALKDLNAEVGKQEIKVKFAADVLFDFDKSEIKREAEPALNKLVTVLKNYTGTQVRVEGHTDGKGADDYNQTLSEKRAEAVSQWLAMKGGLSKSSFSTEGFGSKKPIAPNANADGSDNPQGRAKNRRVEITIKK